MKQFINNLFKNYTLCIIRITLLTTMTLILVSQFYLIKSTLTGEIFNAILVSILILMLIKVNKEVQ